MRRGGAPETAAQPSPLTSMWYSMTWSAPAMTEAAISEAATASADQGPRKFT
jgi:hypothetical protein